MFEVAELGRQVSKEEYEHREPEMRTALLKMQAELQAADFPVLLVFAGVEGAGKSETVNLMHEWMDPRYLQTHAFGPKSDEESERPEFWRYWRRMPPNGRIGIFFGSWYTTPIVKRVDGKISAGAFDSALIRINTFEKQLVDDGALIIKLWFHLSKKAQKARLKELESNPRTSWRVTKYDWELYKEYDEYLSVSEHALRGTDTGGAPWQIVEGTDTRYRYLETGKIILERVNAQLEARTSQAAPRKPAPKSRSERDPVTILDQVDLSARIEKKQYNDELERLQGRLNKLARKANNKKISSILVFEGWDAAGKGGAIRRMTAAMDARDYSVIPIAAPTQEERAQHYLWRFWRHLPRAGRVTIFDRSWYGRVLVERVEGFARDDEWRRAYTEINEFEQEMLDHGMVLCKFWLHISPEEQLRRFKEREQISFKQYKITEEDYRNRDKRFDYEVAANEMFERTSTQEAPWTLVSAEDKRFARIKVLKTLCEALEKRLDS